MEIRYLRYFQTIYQQESFTKATDALFISQPALSKAMHELEAELGITLLDRHRRPLMLTDAGWVLKEFIQNVEIQQRALINTLDDLKQGEGGTIHIGLPPLVSSTMVVDILAQYRQWHPKITLTIQEVGGKEVIPVRKEPLDAVIPWTHRDAKQARLSWADLDGDPLLLYREDYALFDTILDQCAQHHATPEIMQTSSQWDFFGRMAAAGLGMTIIPRSLCHRLVSPTLCIMPLDPTVDWSVALVRPVHAYPSHAMEYLWELIRTMTL